MTTVKDRIPQFKGHWRFDLYQGDPVRAPLPPDQEAENVWAMLRQAEEGWPTLLPMHVGKIISQPYKVLEGENLVTTVGKGLLLDRLFAMGTPPTQVNSMGVGTVATGSAIGDTQMNQGGGGSSFLQAFDALPTRASLVVTAISTFATGVANFNWQELGMFNGTTNGTSLLLNRIAPIGPFTKTSAVAIGVTVLLTQG